MILLLYIFRFIPQSVGTFTLSFSFSLLFGQGLEMCGPHRRFAPLLPRTLRRIPQAVNTVTSLPLFSPPVGQGLEMCGPLRRIPQAVSTVATGVCKYAELHSRHCKVSIPQAVSTVTSSPLFSLPFSQGLEMCGPHRRFAPLLPRTLRRIP